MLTSSEGVTASADAAAAKTEQIAAISHRAAIGPRELRAERRSMNLLLAPNLLAGTTDFQVRWGSRQRSSTYRAVEGSEMQQVHSFTASRQEVDETFRLCSRLKKAVQEICDILGSVERLFGSPRKRQEPGNPLRPVPRLEIALPA